jgi:hypothetical protein
VCFAQSASDQSQHRSIGDIGKDLEALSDYCPSQGSVRVPRIYPVRICHIRDNLPPAMGIVHEDLAFLNCGRSTGTAPGMQYLSNPGVQSGRRDTGLSRGAVHILK